MSDDDNDRVMIEREFNYNTDQYICMIGLICPTERPASAFTVVS